MPVRRAWVGAIVGLLVSGCAGKASEPATAQTGGPPPGAGAAPGAGTPAPSPALSPPLTRGHWAYYGAAQGLAQEVFDASADEAGNLYVAGGDALYVKRRSDVGFLRFDAQGAGLTRNCHDAADLKNESPAGAAFACPIISVAGASPGKAFLGFQGVGTDGDSDATWALDSGGADEVAFDAGQGTLTRTRHVFLASPPHQICPSNGNEAFTTACSYPYDWFWVTGRRKLRQVFRIAVNHDTSSPLYGDAWFSGTHATFAALLHDAEKRGWVDGTAGFDPKWADAKDVWEHDHPGITAPSGEFLTGYSHALSIDPRDGKPWGSNGFRTGYLLGYGADLSSKVWWIGPAPPGRLPWYDLWPDDPRDPQGPTDDNVMSMSHCTDGTLWIGSYTHGLARIDPGGGVSVQGLPDPGLHGDSVSAVACDPSDGSLWIGLGWGGVMRLKGGAFELVDTTGLPDLTRQPVGSIQIDRWSSPRVVYFTFATSRDAKGAVKTAGGVGAYDGP